VGGAQQCLKRYLKGRYLGELWDLLWARVWHGMVAGIPVFVDGMAQLRGRYSGVVWV
jgi:uncharacterized membrane protein